MIDKLSGLVLIINTLLPAVFLVLFVGAGLFAWQVLESEVIPKIEGIADDFNSVKIEAEKAAGAVQDVAIKANGRARDAVGRTKKTAELLSHQLAALRKSIDSVVGPIADAEIASPKITFTGKTFEKKIPDPLDPFKQIRIGPITYLTGVKLSTSKTSPFGELGKPFDDIAVALDTVSTELGHAKASATEAAKEIARLEPLFHTFIAFKDEFDTARTALAGISNALRGVLRPLAWAFGIFALLALPWLAISYVTWALGRLKRGYALLTG